MKYDELQQITKTMSNTMSNKLDYDLAWSLSKTMNIPTAYRGKGRPRQTDYLIEQHPFDGKVRKTLITC